MDPALVMSEDDRLALRSRRLERKKQQLLLHLSNKHNTSLEELGGQVDDLGDNVNELESQAEEPGIQAEEPGIQAEEPGIQAEEPGIQAEEPGSQAEEPGIQAEEPGSQAEEPGIQAEEPGIQVEEHEGQAYTHLIKEEEPMDQDDKVAYQDSLWNEDKLPNSSKLFKQGLTERSQNRVEVKLENPDINTDKVRFQDLHNFTVDDDVLMDQEDILVSSDAHLSTQSHQEEGRDPCLETLSCEDKKSIVDLQKLVRKALAFPEFPKHYYDKDADVMEHLLFMFCKGMGKFFSIVPDFRELEPRVQGILLKEGVAKAVFIFGAHQFEEHGGCWPRRLLTPSCTFPNVTMFAVHKFLNDPHTFTRIKTFMGKYCFFFTDETVTVLSLMLAVFDPDDPEVRADVEVAATRDKYLRLFQNYLTHRDPSVSSEAIVSELWLCFAEVQQLIVCFKSSNTPGAGQAAASNTAGHKETAFASSCHELSGDSMLPPKKAFYKRNTKMTEEGESSDVIFLEEKQSSHTKQYDHNERRVNYSEARGERGVTHDGTDLGTTTPPWPAASMQDHNYPISSPQIHGYPQNCLNSPGRLEAIKLNELEITPLPQNYRPSQNYRDIIPETSVNISPSQTIFPLSSHRTTSAFLIPIVRENSSSQMLTLDSTHTQLRDRLQRPENWYNPSKQISVARNLVIGHAEAESGDHVASHFVNTQGSQSCRIPSAHSVTTHQTLDTRQHLPSDIPQFHHQIHHRLSLQNNPAAPQGNHLCHLNQKSSSLGRHLEQPRCSGQSCCDVRQEVQEDHHPRVDVHRHAHSCCPPSYHSQLHSAPLKHSLARANYHDGSSMPPITYSPLRSLPYGDRPSPSFTHSPVGALYHPDRPSPSPSHSSEMTPCYGNSPSYTPIRDFYHSNRSSTHSLVEHTNSRTDQQVLQAVEGILPTKLVKHLTARLRAVPRHLPP
nr:uncharacterized protein LOC123771127 [Procambarus clarkii]